MRSDRPVYWRCTMTCMVLLLLMSSAASAQSLRLLEETTLRSERQVDAPVAYRLAAGERVELVQLSGGWARVTTGQRSGWLRASQIDLDPAEVAAVSLIESGRRAPGASAVTLGVRALPLRSTRHALIIGVGKYRSDPGRPVAALAGVGHDMASALSMAQHMQVPVENITMLRDEDATSDAVQQALRDLDARLRAGDRVFLYWSGHGSRNFDSREGCVETLVPHDLRDISNRQFAQWLSPLARKAEKMLVIYDACHSGGIGSAARESSRSALSRWTAKSAATPAECQQPRNLRTRGLASAASALGIDGQDLVHLSSSRHDEISFDNADSGGLATSSLLACMKGEARDLNGSGAISIEEIVACAQPRIDLALRGQTQFDPPHFVISGNRDFVPTWLAGGPAATGSVLAAATTPTTAKPPAETRPVPLGPTVPVPVAAEPPLQAVLEHLHAQRDSKRRVEIRVVSDRLRIGTDALDFSITSSHDGHVYIAMLGSDRQSLHLLFPNELDGRNRIAAGESMLLPREAWRITASGPRGEDTLLVMVSDGPRDLAALGGGRAGPFAKPLTDAEGRVRLQWLLGSHAQGGPAGCRGAGCSDAFGSALLKLQEY